MWLSDFTHLSQHEIANYLRRTRALEEATIEDSSGSGGVGELVALEPEVFVNPQVTVNSQLDIDNWDDEF